MRLSAWRAQVARGRGRGGPGRPPMRACGEAAGEPDRDRDARCRARHPAGRRDRAAHLPPPRPLADPALLPLGWDDAGGDEEAPRRWTRLRRGRRGGRRSPGEGRSARRGRVALRAAGLRPARGRTAVEGWGAAASPFQPRHCERSEAIHGDAWHGLLRRLRPPRNDDWGARGVVRTSLWGRGLGGVSWRRRGSPGPSSLKSLLVRRLVQAVPVLLIVICLDFFLLAPRAGGCGRRASGRAGRQRRRPGGAAARRLRARPALAGAARPLPLPMSCGSTSAGRSASPARCSTWCWSGRATPRS